MFEYHLQDAEEHFEIVKASRIGAGVVRHEEEEEDKDKVLDAEGEPVNYSPVGVLGDDSGNETSDENSAEEARDYD